MSVTTHVYGLAMQSILSGEVAWLTHDIKVALYDNTFVLDQDNDRYLTDLTGTETAGAGYTAGGQLLSSKTIAYDATTNRLVLSAADPTWPAATFTAHYAVFYRDTGNAATSPLLVCWDLGADVSSPGGDFVLTVNTDGILNLTTPVAA